MAGASGTAAGPAEADIPGRGGGWGSWIGNTLFFGGVAATAYFGYYTYRYSSDQLDTMVQETQKAENAFPGSQVGSPHGSTPTVWNTAAQPKDVHGSFAFLTQSGDLQVDMSSNDLLDK